MNLVDDDGIPVDFFQVGTVLRGLERVEGDNDAWEVRKRVAGSRQLLTDLLDAHRVQAHERDGKPRPHLLLHLFHDVLRRDDKNALAAPAPDELGEDHTHLERLTQTDRVGDEHARAQVVIAECLSHRCVLILQRVHQHVRGH